MQFIRSNTAYKITIYILEVAEVKASFVQKMFLCRGFFASKIVVEQYNSLKETIIIGILLIKMDLYMEEDMKHLF